MPRSSRLSSPEHPSAGPAYGVAGPALALALCVIGLAALGALALRGVSIDVFDLLGRGENPVHRLHPGDPRVTVPALFSGLLCALAAGLVLARRRDARSHSTIMGLLLGLLAVAELTALEERLVSASILSPMAIAFALAAPAAVIALLGGTHGAWGRTPRALVLAAGATWIAAALVQGSANGAELAVRATAEVLEMAAAGLFALGLLAVRNGVTGEGRDRARALTDFVLAIDAPRLAVALAVCIVAFGVLGTLFRSGTVDLAAFDMNAERSAPTLFSGLLLFAAAGLAAVAATAAPPDRHRRVWWWLLGGLFAFLAFDEVAAVHERLQFWTGAFGQLSLLPILALGGLAGLITLRRLQWHRLGQALLVAGAAAWLATQLVDAVQSSGRLDALSVPEEMLEMSGSACFCLAILTALQAARRSSPTASGDPSGPAVHEGAASGRLLRGPDALARHQHATPESGHEHAVLIERVGAHLDHAAIGLRA